MNNRYGANKQIKLKELNIIPMPLTHDPDGNIATIDLYL